MILVFEALRNLSPWYLQELISLCCPSRTLRLSAYPRLNCNSYNLESYGPRTSWCRLAPTLERLTNLRHKIRQSSNFQNSTKNSFIVRKSFWNSFNDCITAYTIYYLVFFIITPIAAHRLANHLIYYCNTLRWVDFLFWRLLGGASPYETF